MDPTTLESLIVREIRKATHISRRDLAERLEVSRSTAGRRVDSLIERGMIEESGVEEREDAGRPKRFLGLCGEYGRFVGFDFDARNLYAVVTDFSRHKIRTFNHSFSTEPDRSEVFSSVNNIIEEIERMSNSILGYGFGIPGKVNSASKVAESYPYIKGWKDVDVCDELSLVSVPVHIENNSKTIALSEHWLGSRMGCENLICLNIRTGISAAVISGGHLLKGHNGMAGEIRGWKVNGQSLEDVSTAKCLRERGGFGSWPEFVRACLKGDSEAILTLQQMTQKHADTISRIIQLADPEVVFVAGTFNDFGETYLNRLKELVAIELKHHYFSIPDIEFVTHGEYAGAMGAAALAAKHYLPDK